MPSVSTNKRILIQSPHEGSRLRMPSDENSQGMLWKKLQKLIEQVENHSIANQLLSSKVEGVRRRILGGVSSLSDSGGYMGELDDSFAYSEGQEFTVSGLTTVGGITWQPGLYGILPAGHSPGTLPTQAMSGVNSGKTAVLINPICI